jgi:hypothetical protein
VSATHPSKTAPRARRILCFAKSPSGFGINDIAAVVSTSVLALKLTDERLAAEIHQHRMMFDVKPAAENIETAVLGQGNADRFPAAAR